MEEAWVPLESDHQSLSQFAWQLGLSSQFCFSECFSFEEEFLSFVPQPCHAVILLFPVKAQHAFQDPLSPEETNILWIKQVVKNACGTYAVLHALINNKQLLQPFSDIEQYAEKLEKLPIAKRPDLIKESGFIFQAHNSVINSDSRPIPDANAEYYHHYTTFIHQEGKLYELDGRRTGPLCHGESSEETFLKDSIKIIKRNYIDYENNANVDFCVLTLGSNAN